MQMFPILFWSIYVVGRQGGVGDWGQVVGDRDGWRKGNAACSSVTQLTSGPTNEVGGISH